ncbi:MAG: DUF433 domain-containing protein [Acidobacteriota bacterium]|nr:DUF433 domain-containing protein [Acidobacteriota bacterium]
MSQTAFAERMTEESASPSAPPITINPERLGGTPVIGTYRLPVSRLIDYFAAGYTLDEFLDEYDGTDRATVLAALERIKQALDDGWLAERVDY